MGNNTNRDYNTPHLYGKLRLAYTLKQQHVTIYIYIFKDQYLQTWRADIVEWSLNIQRSNCITLTLNFINIPLTVMALPRFRNCSFQ